MRIALLLRTASLTAALCLPMAAAFADSQPYDFETDLWPAIQAEMQAQRQVEVATQGRVRDLGVSDPRMTVRSPQGPAYYDELDQYLDPQTGIPRPEARNLFGE